MKEYEDWRDEVCDIASKNLFDQLKRRVYGKIYVCIEDYDRIHVTIYTDEIGHYDFIKEGYFDSIIRSEMTAERMAIIIVRDYRNYINRTFFKFAKGAN